MLLHCKQGFPSISHNVFFINTALEYVKGIHCLKAHTRLGTLEAARKKGIIPSLQMKLIPIILQLYLTLPPASHN